ncbi:LPXTG cell wall anchor domain-containing protein [uncultured Microbacterium sp.]|uniref:LPXTG cell wall anchor domain-containing protein n=1 Tax=uncultured Microbacterium sp. TaxID=191216 RepID=UPI0025E821D5|nr:LPXTG cell wall anchor domain-containing protein [uncultured Microbacterium sp.]
MSVAVVMAVVLALAPSAVPPGDAADAQTIVVTVPGRAASPTPTASPSPTAVVPSPAVAPTPAISPTPAAGPLAVTGVDPTVLVAAAVAGVAALGLGLVALRRRRRA